MTKRSTKEQRAASRARQRQAKGDPRPYMILLAVERRRLNIVVPASRSRKCVNVLGKGGTL